MEKALKTKCYSDVGNSSKYHVPEKLHVLVPSLCSLECCYLPEKKVIIQD